MAWFAYSGEQVLAEYEDSGALDAFQPSRKFVYGAYVDEPLLLLSCSELAGGGRTETAYYYHQDRNFNVIALTDDTGQVVDRYSYSAYGEIETLTNGGTKITSNPYFFTGRRFDAELRIYYYRARYHDPALGRFLSRDPLEYVDGMSLYEYVKGRPLAGLDPKGMKKIQLFGLEINIPIPTCGYYEITIKDTGWLIKNYRVEGLHWLAKKFKNDNDILDKVKKDTSKELKKEFPKKYINKCDPPSTKKVLLNITKIHILTKHLTIWATKKNQKAVHSKVQMLKLTLSLKYI